MSSLIQDLLTLTLSPSPADEAFTEYDPDTLLLDIYEKYLTILDKGIIIKQLKIQGQPTQKRRHWRQRAAFLRGG